MDVQLELKQQWYNFLRQSQLWIVAFILVVGLTAILSLNLVTIADVGVIIGQPAPTDVLAPRTHSYTSDVLTSQNKQIARQNVPPVYDFDSSVGRQQLNKARAVFAFIEVVRSDPFANAETKLLYLQTIDGLVVEDQVGLDVLSLSVTDYETARLEVLNTIDEFMRQEISEEELSGFQRLARRSSLVLTPIQDNVVTNLTYQFIVPTIFLNETITEQRQSEAEAAVETVQVRVTQDQRVIRAGDIIDEADIEMLTELGLLQQNSGWREVASSFIAAVLTVIFLALYWQQFHNVLHENIRYLSALVAFFLLFVLAAKLIVPRPGYWPFAFPIAALSMLFAVIFDIRFAILVTVLTAALTGFMVQSSLEVGVYTAAGGLMAILNLRDAERLSTFFRAGLAAAVGHIAVLLIFRLPQEVEAVELGVLISYGLVNGVFAALLTILGFFVVGAVFRITTTIQLQELSRLNHPLIQQLLRKAPGTYHHSIMLANLAEQAAERVKANSTLVRVGAFYHDIGKMNRAPFFTENQESGHNPHNNLDLYSSARIIVSHVTDGLELASHYRLPDRIRDFIVEHHGTRIVKGFYLKAVEQADGDETAVDKEKFRYNGRSPRSRESGIVMLADAIEATSSALRPNSEKAIEKLVNSIIDDILTEGQLDDSGLTMGDIGLIRASFIETLKGRFHVRVKYPGNDDLLVNELSVETESVTTETTTASLPAPAPLPMPTVPPELAELPNSEETSTAP